MIILCCLGIYVGVSICISSWRHLTYRYWDILEKRFQERKILVGYKYITYDEKQAIKYNNPPPISSANVNMHCHGKKYQLWG